MAYSGPTTPVQITDSVDSDGEWLRTIEGHMTFVKRNTPKLQRPLLPSAHCSAIMIAVEQSPLVQEMMKSPLIAGKITTAGLSAFAFFSKAPFDFLKDCSLVGYFTDILQQCQNHKIMNAEQHEETLGIGQDCKALMEKHGVENMEQLDNMLKTANQAMKNSLTKPESKHDRSRGLSLFKWSKKER